MSPKTQLRRRLRVILNMTMVFTVVILLAQLWLFTVVLEAMASADAPDSVAAVALVVSFLATVAVWTLIRFFLCAERT